MIQPEAGLRTGQLAARAGVNIQTLRYYERRNLLAPPIRRPSGQRTYPETAVSLLRCIKGAQRLGFNCSCGMSTGLPLEERGRDTQC